MKKFLPSKEQQQIFDSNKKRMVISASAGSGKTTTMIEYISRLALGGVKVKRMLVLTFTKAAASEMKERLMLSLMALSDREEIRNQIDDLFTSDISTIHSFLEKIIKRNLHIFPYLEGFRILDEKESSSLMEEAFDESVNEMKTTHPKEFYDLFTTIKANNTIKLMMFGLTSYLAAQVDRAEAVKRLQDYDQNLENAKQFFKEKLSQELINVTQLIDSCPVGSEKFVACLAAARESLQINKSDLKEFVKACAEIKFPAAPKMSDDDPLKAAWQEIKGAKDDVKKIASKLEPDNDEIWNGRKNRITVSEIFVLFDLFNRIYSEKKQKINALDFNDLELNAEKLLDDPFVLEQLQENYDYVFIDEYQDTNPVQEKIVKLIAQKGRFIAIGDPKQGIYGFRNASSKIIIKDSIDYEKTCDSETHYLSTNYRSDKKILDFVNNIFSKVMTQGNANIDYKNSSMLHGEKEAPKIGDAAVEIFVVPATEKEKKQPMGDYDIYEDELSAGEENLEAKVIAAKLDEILSRYFVDVQTGERRKVQPSDIAILVRGRGGNIQNILNELKRKEIPFVCSLKTDIMAKAHSNLIKQLLTLWQDPTNEIALTSFLLSPLALVSMDKLALLPREKGESICEAIYKSEDEQITKALARFEKFKSDCMFLGTKEALEKYFIEKEYFVYLKSRLGEDAVNETQALLEVIGNYDCDKDVPALLSYLKTEIGQTNVSGANAVTISTIHASKGLEYPIVFLAQTGASLVKADLNSFKISDRFGFGTTCFNEEKPSVILQAIKQNEAQQTRVDELMVLYVALTRAKSHLIVTGTIEDKEIEPYSEENFKKIKSNMHLILSTQPERVGAKISFVDEVETLQPQVKRVEMGAADETLVEKINNYLNFVYPFESQTKIKQKTSVTALASENTEAVSTQSFFAEEGTAYHEALKILDFDKIEKAEDVKEQLILQKFNKNYLKIVDFNSIFENIILIKPFTKNKTIIKEKEFTMSIDDHGDRVLVQGTIDLYLKGEKNILIDYKFTRESDEKKLIERYKKQLDLYAQAIENAEKIKVDEIYLISLKNHKIISYKK